MIPLTQQGTDAYTVDKTELPIVQTQNDLGVNVSQNLKINSHCHMKVDRVDGTPESVCGAFNHVNVKTFQISCTVFVRPKFECCMQAASTCIKRDDEQLTTV